MADALYEPWRPEIGQRVRIRLSAECDVSWADSRYLDGHPAEADGVTGVVVEDPYGTPVPWQDTHPYVVLFDAPLSAPVFADGSEAAWRGNYFAAAELEPIPAAPEPSHAGGEG